jgi:AMIN domain
MSVRQHLCEICLFAALVAQAAAQNPHPASVRKLSVANQNPIRLQIETTEAVSPQVQIVSSPERLVIDIPNSTPGPELHGIAVNRGEVKGVRVSLFSTTPPVTRIVVDLKQPQWYRVAPDAAGFLVTLGSDRESAADSQPTIGWVSTRVSAKIASTQGAPVLVRKNTTGTTAAIGGSRVMVQYMNGLLTIHAHGATLSEVLFQIQKQTGAEIAIPAGTEQDQVAADFGPGRPSEVLAQLLNGSGLNFVAVGSEADLNALRSVILSRNSGAPVEPAQFAAPTYTPPTAENIEPPDSEVMAPPPGEPNPQAQDLAGNAPPIEAPPN